MNYQDLQKEHKITDSQLLVLVEISREGYLSRTDAMQMFFKQTITSLIKRGFIKIGAANPGWEDEYVLTLVGNNIMKP